MLSYMMPAPLYFFDLQFRSLKFVCVMFINGSVVQCYKKKSHLFSEYEEPQFSEIWQGRAKVRRSCRLLIVKLSSV
jgi:hypothetical protein